MHKEVVFDLKSVLEQWNKKLSSGSHIVLGKCFNFYSYLEKAERSGIMCFHSFRDLVSKFLTISQVYGEFISHLNFRMKLHLYNNVTVEVDLGAPVAPGH